MALVIGMLAASAAWTRIPAVAAAHAAAGKPWSTDFAYWWQGARAVVDGKDPYTAVGSQGPYPVRWTFGGYPLTALVVTAPLARFTHDTAVALFIGAGFMVAAFALTRHAWWPLIALASAPAIFATENGQWAPSLLGATLTPALGGLLTCKPNVGIALAVYRPTLTAVVSVVALLMVTFLVQPTWPADWLRALAAIREGEQYVSPITVGPGVLCLLALLRWRRPEGRLLAALACVPQNYFFYDQLYLLLVPRNWREMTLMTLWTHLLAYVAQSTVVPATPTLSGVSLALAPFVVWGLYLPCLAMVLRRPNEGPVPAWLERWLTHPRVPAWIRGRAPEPA